MTEHNCASLERKCCVQFVSILEKFGLNVSFCEKEGNGVGCAGLLAAFVSPAAPRCKISPETVSDSYRPVNSSGRLWRIMLTHHHSTVMSLVPFTASTSHRLPWLMQAHMCAGGSGHSHMYRALHVFPTASPRLLSPYPKCTHTFSCSRYCLVTSFCPLRGFP